MNQAPYPFSCLSERYIFVSKGDSEIIKTVEFTAINNLPLFNLCFGDLLPDNTINDIVVSNNGDIKRVLSTVIHIVADFLERNQKAEILFFGSSAVRTALYARILKVHRATLIKNYTVIGLIMAGNNIQPIEFDPHHTRGYVGFSIKRKH